MAWVRRISLGGDDALVGVGRRHLDVDDGDVRFVELDVAQELAAVLGLADDVDAASTSRRASPHEAASSRRQGLRAWDLGSQRHTPPSSVQPVRLRRALHPFSDPDAVLEQLDESRRALVAAPRPRRLAAHRRGVATRHLVRPALTASATTRYAAFSTGAGHRSSARPRCTSGVARARPERRQRGGEPFVAEHARDGCRGRARATRRPRAAARRRPRRDRRQPAGRRVNPTEYACT